MEETNPKLAELEEKNNEKQTQNEFNPLEETKLDDPNKKVF